MRQKYYHAFDIVDIKKNVPAWLETQTTLEIAEEIFTFLKKRTPRNIHGESFCIVDTTVLLVVTIYHPCQALFV